MKATRTPSEPHHGRFRRATLFRSLHATTIVAEVNERENAQRRRQILLLIPSRDFIDKAIHCKSTLPCDLVERAPELILKADARLLVDQHNRAFSYDRSLLTHAHLSLNSCGGSARRDLLGSIDELDTTTRFAAIHDVARLRWSAAGNARRNRQLALAIRADFPDWQSLGRRAGTIHHVPCVYSSRTVCLRKIYALRAGWSTLLSVHFAHSLQGDSAGPFP